MAPISIAKTAKDRMLKADRGDTHMLVWILAYRSYKQVVLPTENILTIKKAVRVRVSVLKSYKNVKQNLLAFLLYHGISYPGSKMESEWTVKFFTCLRTITFSSDYMTYFLEEYVSEVARQIRRLDQRNLQATWGSFPAGMTADFLSGATCLGITKQGNQTLRHLLVKSAKSINRVTALSHGQKSEWTR